MAQTPSNSFHYMGIGKEAQDGVPVVPSVLIKYNEYTGNAQIENDEDKGHVGARGLGGSVDRTKAFAEPEITDRLRTDGPLENILNAFFGKVVTTSPGGGTTAKKHTYEMVDVLPTYTITHGFNFASEVARTFAGAVCNGIEFTFNTEEAPTYVAKFLSDFPEFGADEPTLTFPLAKPFKAGQLKPYWGDVGATPTEIIPGYKEGSLNISNNFENSGEAGVEFGKIAKDMGDLTVEGSMTLKYTKDYQREWATGSSTGTKVIEEGWQKALRFQYVGPVIEGSTKRSFTIDVLNAEITNVTPSEGGEGPKTLEIEFQGMADDSNQKLAAEIISTLATI